MIGYPFWDGAGNALCIADYLSKGALCNSLCTVISPLASLHSISLQLCQVPTQPFNCLAMTLAFQCVILVRGALKQLASFLQPIHSCFVQSH